MEVDHLFLFIDKDGPEPARLAELGFSETYWRIHKGQGMANICYAFENMFLELLWIENAHEALSPSIERTPPRAVELAQFARLSIRDRLAQS